MKVQWINFIGIISLLGLVAIGMADGATLWMMLLLVAAVVALGALAGWLQSGHERNSNE